MTTIATLRPLWVATSLAVMVAACGGSQRRLAPQQQRFEPAGHRTGADGAGPVPNVPHIHVAAIASPALADRRARR